MNELSTTRKQLPDTLEDLSKFVLVGREKLNAVRAEIRAIKKVQLAVEVHEQKLQEAQEIAEAVLDAETKLGELTAEMETAKGQRTDVKPIPSDGEKSKKEQLKDIGINHYERYETLARHPEIVEQAKDEARAEGRIVTRQDVLNRIATPKSVQQTMKDFKRQAREEHEEFETTKKESIVGFDDIQREKKNEEIIALDVKITINKAFESLATIDLLDVKELDLMLEKMSLIDKTSMIAAARRGLKTITHLINRIGD